MRHTIIFPMPIYQCQSAADNEDPKKLFAKVA